MGGIVHHDRNVRCYEYNKYSKHLPNSQSYRYHTLIPEKNRKIEKTLAGIRYP